MDPVTFLSTFKKKNDIFRILNLKKNMNGIEELINRYIFCNYQKIILRSFLNFEVSPFQKSLQFCFNFYIIILDPVTFLSIFKKKRYFSYFKLKIKKFEWNRRINESIHSLRLRNYSSIIPQLWSFAVSKISSTRHIQS